MTVDILGTGYSIRYYNWADDNERWSIGSAYDDFKEKDISTYFCMHKWQHMEVDNVYDLSNYPLKEVIEKYGSRYFTNSIGYMIALALFKGYTEINLYGVDMDMGDEYAFERPCVLYWVGFARGMGVKVTLASGTDDPYFLYGFDDNSKLIKKMEERMKWSFDQGEEFEAAGKQKHADQYYGQYADIRYWLNEIKG